VRVVGSQDPQIVGEQLLGGGGRTGWISGLSPPTGEVAAGGQGVRIPGPADSR